MMYTYKLQYIQLLHNVHNCKLYSHFLSDSIKKQQIIIKKKKKKKYQVVQRHLIDFYFISFFFFFLKRVKHL